MNIVNDLGADALAYWAGLDPLIITMRAPTSMDDCSDCKAVHTTTAGGQRVIRVAWKPDEIELAHLARGGTIWLSCYGGLPPHMLEVQAP